MAGHLLVLMTFIECQVSPLIQVRATNLSLPKSGGYGVQGKDLITRAELSSSSFTIVNP